MRIAITGSGGFVGQHLIKLLNQKPNYEIFEISTKKNFHIQKWDSINEIKVKIDVVIHLAAKTFVPDAYKTPIDFYNFNYISTLNALELARNNQAKFIFISSYVYGHPKYTPIDEYHTTEDFNPYAGSKLLSEQLCASYAKNFGLNCIILRPFNIYGVGQPSTLVFQNILQQIDEGKVILKDSRPKRDYLHVTDLAAAIEKSIAFNSNNKVEIFNIGFGTSYSLQNVLELFKEHLPNLQYDFTNEQRPNEILDTCCNSTKAKNELNWQPLINLKEGIKELIKNHNSK